MPMLEPGIVCDIAEDTLRARLAQLSFTCRAVFF
jgi:hypothetical protein